MSKRNCCHIPMKLHPKTITTLGFFLGKLANVLLRNFYYNALGAFFDALIQRTDGCTEFLWLLVQTHHIIRCSHKRCKNRHFNSILYRRLRRACANVHTPKSLCCQHKKSWYLLHCPVTACTNVQTHQSIRCWHE